MEYVKRQENNMHFVADSSILKVYSLIEEYVNPNSIHLVKACEHFNAEQWEKAITEFQDLNLISSELMSRHKIIQCNFELGKWQNADHDLPDLINATERLKKLKQKAIN
jgi:hypothetical protein